MAKKPAEDPLVAKAFGAGSQEDLAKLIGNLNQAEADYFLKKLEAALKKRKMQIVGYLVAMFVWVVGMLLGLAYFGTHSGFTGWVFLVPFLFVGLILWLFGALAERAGRQIPPDPTVAVPDPK